MRLEDGEGDDLWTEEGAGRNSFEQEVTKVTERWRKGGFGSVGADHAGGQNSDVWLWSRRFEETFMAQTLCLAFGVLCRQDDGEQETHVSRAFYERG